MYNTEIKSVADYLPEVVSELSTEISGIIPHKSNVVFPEVKLPQSANIVQVKRDAGDVDEPPTAMILLESDDANHLALEKAITPFLLLHDFSNSYQIAIRSWNKTNRTLKYNAEIFENNIPCYDKFGDWGHKYIKYYKFSPITDKNKTNRYLYAKGFYSRYLNFDLDWHKTEFHRDLLQDFFTQYVIKGENNKGIYICGDIGVGKSTTITAIAKVLLMFLDINVYYTTMAKLVSLITSPDRDDKERISVYKKCPILFIDNLGLEEYTTNNQLTQVIDFFTYRYGNEKTNIIAGNGDIRKIEKPNSFIKQMSDYLNDSNYYSCYEMGGKSKRT